MATVELRGVRKRFGRTEVIHGIDLTVADGEFVVLIGPSGCGKSTLLRMIAGLEETDGGAVLIGGRDVTGAPARERGVAMVFQSYALYPHMTGAANVGFPLRLAGATEGERRSRVERAAEALGLADHLERYPRELSGGQRQRVAMGRAIVREPEVFLFDEPLSNLDAALRVAMRGEIKELHGSLGTTTVYVTHDQIEAMTLADRIVVLRDGRVEQEGPPLELYDRPANRFVAGFLGSPAMSFLEVEIEDGAARFPDGDRLALSAPGVPGPATLGLRPEAFSLAPEPSDATISAEVAVVEPTGSETELLLRKAGRPVTATFRERLDLRRGDVVHLAPTPDQTHVFDSTTGQRRHT